MRSTAYLLSAATIAVAAPAAAQVNNQPTTQADVQAPAQNTANADVDAQSHQATDADNSQAATGTNAGGFSAGDIVVTATRRAERLSNVPIAVSAISQEQLQNTGATDIRQLTQVTPSLLVSSTGTEANASARIRGIGTVGDNPGLESSVAVFIDGVYRSRTGSGLNDLGEIDRIEVLRGPQGTLSGRNSSAGAINILTKAPDFKFGGYAELTGGNYDFFRGAVGITGPIIADKLAFRIDGVASKRDGFLYDVTNKDDFNDRNRYFVRGQLLLQASDAIQFRLIGDYTYRNEKCCGAVYVDTREKIDPTPGVPGDYALSATNRIVDVMTSLGGVLPSRGDPYNRRISLTPGRNYAQVTKDYGGSGQIDWNLGGASLTSITAYREYKSDGQSDIDYNNLDIGYRADDGNSYRQFHTFSQELRLNGEAFGDRLNWLVGGYYSNEDLQVVDNLKFGTQYGAFAACRIVATINPLAALRDPTKPGCLGTTPLAALGGATGRQAVGAGLGAASALVLPNIDRLSTLNNLGTTRDVYNQNSENYAFFTHNILKLTDQLSVTGGLRYTHERKRFDATFGNNNTVCPGLQGTSAQGGLRDLLTNPQLGALAGGIITLGCTGNSSVVLNGKSINDSFSESQLTGTGVVSYKPTSDLMLYASYSRGYKAGGYNLDRSDLGAAVNPLVTAAPNAKLLRFDPETVNAYEVGLKLSTRQFTLNVAAFRQEFKNFQLNTFNGTVYVVQNIGSCANSLNGGDQDGSAATGACTGDVKYGVRSQGVEIEAGIYPTRNFSVNLGYTLADTKYRRNLVGNEAGEALDPALFLLPGSRLSNAPRNVVTSAVSWTPDLGSSGLSALFYADGRLSSDYNTGSDLFYEKAQDGFFLLNARIGLRGPDRRWSIEAWAQNLTNQNYEQVAFNAPFQGAGSIGQTIRLGTTPANQVFDAFIAEPRTYGVTVRTRF
jgi:iron complex outermembrane receptor protein